MATLKGDFITILVKYFPIHSGKYSPPILRPLQGSKYFIFIGFLISYLQIQNFHSSRLVNLIQLHHE